MEEPPVVSVPASIKLQKIKGDPPKMFAEVGLIVVGSLFLSAKPTSALSIAALVGCVMLWRMRSQNTHWCGTVGLVLAGLGALRSLFYLTLIFLYYGFGYRW